MGKLKFQLILKKAWKFNLKIRIPGWALNEAIPGGLYKFTDQNNEPVKLQVNGKEYPVKYERWICCHLKKMEKGR